MMNVYLCVQVGWIRLKRREERIQTLPSPEVPAPKGFPARCSLPLPSLPSLPFPRLHTHRIHPSARHPSSTPVLLRCSCPSEQMEFSPRPVSPPPCPSPHAPFLLCHLHYSITPPGTSGSSYRVATRQHVDKKVPVNRIPTPTRLVPSHKSGPDVPGQTGRTTHTPSGKCSSNPGRKPRRKSTTTSFHPHQWPTTAPSPTSALPSPPPFSPSASEQSGNRNVPCLGPACRGS